MIRSSPILTATKPAIDTPVQENNPELWRAVLQPKYPDGNKYDYGHVLVYGGPRMTGAACMAAHAVMRIGAGLCTISAPEEQANVYRGYQANLMIEERRKIQHFKRQMKDKRRSVILIGPGAGLEKRQPLRDLVYDIARDGRPCVLDADAINVVKNWRHSFYKALGPQCVLTPHEGEFARIFPQLKGTRVERAQTAAQRCGAVMVLKGNETIIAGPDGQVAVNKTASPDLASAGTGDVLSGMIAGLLARKLSPFMASCAAVWIHGRAAQHFGSGLMATDLFDQIPAVLKELAS